MNGIVNIHKEKGYTSHDVVNIVRRITKCKAGHTGTLDPNATGVLPVCLGRATKIADYIMADDKEYVAQVIFGAATDTQDTTGEIVDRKPVDVDMHKVYNVLPQFVGQITQIPPMYSAIKVDGKKLYEYARQGTEIERKARHITIHAIEVLAEHLPESIRIRVACSKGTYIRTLCTDLGAALGTAAHMGELVRTKSGGFCLENSITLAQLEELTVAGQLQQNVISIESALAHFPKINISSHADKWLKNGNKIPVGFVSCDKLQDGVEYLAFDASGSLAGIYVATGDGHIKPKVVLF
ncbi:MAG: tRNA pseudouridine(55) synthase TruB [Defluviitaleaceae bacterium]|nr:tRNA pseudouridine(55) synthase TruB [Defluviitaleaceae bacterium]